MLMLVRLTFCISEVGKRFGWKKNQDYSISQAEKNQGKEST